ncbi:hypothetical protein [Sinomicrobium sp.]
MMKQLVFLFLLISSGVLMAQDTPLKQKEYQLGAQRTVPEGYVSLNKEAVYTGVEGYYYSWDIDFIYLHGKSTGANLMVPTNDAGLRAFSKSLLAKVSAWKQRNDGTFIKLDQKDAKTVFDGVNSLETLKELFNVSRNNTVYNDSHDPLLQGPGGRLTKLEVGDVVLFKSKARDSYAIGYISDIENPGTRGTLTLVLKYKS